VKRRCGNPRRALDDVGKSNEAVSIRVDENAPEFTLEAIEVGAIELTSISHPPVA
jgi:hypothetical protein